jgi:hypothetical protein
MCPNRREQAWPPHTHGLIFRSRAAPMEGFGRSPIFGLRHLRSSAESMEVYGRSPAAIQHVNVCTPNEKKVMEGLQYLASAHAQLHDPTQGQGGASPAAPNWQASGWAHGPSHNVIDYVTSLTSPATAWTQTGSRGCQRRAGVPRSPSPTRTESVSQAPSRRSELSRPDRDSLAGSALALGCYSVLTTGSLRPLLP